MTTAVLIGDVLLLVGGYVAAIYTWPRVKVLVNGLENEARALRAKAVDLEAKIKGLGK
ncbi:MAG: hypothetical protein WBA62_22060 [Xanthobacteraceae bacterium]